MCAPPAELPGPGLGRADLPPLPPAAAALGPEEPDAEAEGRGGGPLGPAAHPPRPPHALPDQGGAGGGCRHRGRGDILTPSIASIRISMFSPISHLQIVLGRKFPLRAGGGHDGAGVAVVLQEVRGEAGRGQPRRHGRDGGEAAGRPGVHQVTAVLPAVIL